VVETDRDVEMQVRIESPDVYFLGAPFGLELAELPEKERATGLPASSAAAP
jgi:hypothetical protein